MAKRIPILCKSCGEKKKKYRPYGVQFGLYWCESCDAAKIERMNQRAEKRKARLKLLKEIQNSLKMKPTKKEKSK